MGEREMIVVIVVETSEVATVPSREIKETRLARLLMVVPLQR